jgi:RNA polymerase sigma factor (sigma-70 family)
MYLAVEVLPERGTGGGVAEHVGVNDLEDIYAFIYARVGNRPDAEDLTQEVALKALPRLDRTAPALAVRGYLFATARSVLATFWSGRLRMPESELPDTLGDSGPPPAREPSVESAQTVASILASLAPNHRRVLELRFLRGYTLNETALELGKTVGSVKIMQLRALRAAAALGPSTRISAIGSPIQLSAVPR